MRRPSTACNSTSPGAADTPASSPPRLRQLRTTSRVGPLRSVPARPARPVMSRTAPPRMVRRPRQARTGPVRRRPRSPGRDHAARHRSGTWHDSQRPGRAIPDDRMTPHQGHGSQLSFRGSPHRAAPTAAGGRADALEPITMAKFAMPWSSFLLPLAPSRPARAPGPAQPRAALPEVFPDDRIQRHRRPLHRHRPGLFIIDGVLAMLMRAELARPGLQFLSNERYNQLFTMPGTIHRPAQRHTGAVRFRQ